jgi:hypothetical protein
MGAISGRERVILGSLGVARWGSMRSHVM